MKYDWKRKLNRYIYIHRFLRYLSYYTANPMSPLEHDYSKLSQEFNVKTLKSIHDSIDILFVNRILTNHYIPDHLKSLFMDRQINYNLRNCRPIEESHSSGDFVFHSPLHRLRREWNKLSLEIEIPLETTTLKAYLSKNRLKYYS